MAILISLPPDLEAKLQAEAERQGQDIAVVAADLLSDILEWDEDDTEAAIQCKASQVNQRIATVNQDSDNHYNSTQWMMPLSFILIAIATITVIASRIFDTLS